MTASQFTRDGSWGWDAVAERQMGLALHQLASELADELLWRRKLESRVPPEDWLLDPEEKGDTP